jgi:hypothetical protein
MSASSRRRELVRDGGPGHAHRDGADHGGSHCHGDISLDLESGWVRRASRLERVVSETKDSGVPDPIHGVAEPAIAIRNLTR